MATSFAAARSTGPMRWPPRVAKACGSAPCTRTSYWSSTTSFGPDDSLQALDVGSLIPPHATALGKALLAHHRYLATDLAERDLASYTTGTITDGYRLGEELEQISRRGWASEIEELYLGLASIAAPIEDRRRVVVGAIGISGAIERICDGRSPRAELVGYVMESARAISRELGGMPW